MLVDSGTVTITMIRPSSKATRREVMYFLRFRSELSSCTSWWRWEFELF